MPPPLLRFIVAHNKQYKTRFFQNHMSPKEARVRSITKLYYSKPEIQKAIFEFGKDREVVPSYMMESFGKRPDSLQYPNDVIGMVSKGATSFHASEELWSNPLEIDSEMSLQELNELRHSWDLLIDIDSPYLDYSKTAAILLLDELEKHGIKNYGIKFSGSKGFHLIVPAKAFPTSFRGIETKEMFPEWPRAISKYLLHRIKPAYNKKISSQGVNFEALKERTKLSREDVTEINCPTCGQQAKKTNLVHFKCDRCGIPYARPNFKVTKRKLKCTDDTCPGFMEIMSEEDYFFCENCKTKLKIDTTNKFWQNPSFRSAKTTFSTESKTAKTSEDFKEEISATKLGSLDLVLVSSRHLFRMPYSLHEKTCLASVVLRKDQIAAFNPKDANPLSVKVLPFCPDSREGEATGLLEQALSWEERYMQEQESEIKKKYSDFAPTDFSNVSEEMFPKPIKKLLKGLQEGRKRGLFVLLTFLKSLNFSPAYINDNVREWNKKNSPPLKEGYIKSQIDWHIKQKKKILPPNYSNDNFYKDLKLLDEKPHYKNPIAEVASKIRKNNTQ